MPQIVSRKFQIPVRTSKWIQIGFLVNLGFYWLSQLLPKMLSAEHLLTWAPIVFWTWLLAASCFACWIVRGVCELLDDVRFLAERFGDAKSFRIEWRDACGGCRAPLSIDEYNALQCRSCGEKLTLELPLPKMEN